MPLKKPPTRSSLRRKMVLPVTVSRRQAQEELQAHTLDLTEVPARLGGLSSLLQPGELIEIQRGGMKAKFQVFWMGTPGSAMEGQAGVRSVEPNKNIWGNNLPSDEPDPVAAMAITRSDMQNVCTGAKAAGESARIRGLNVPDEPPRGPTIRTVPSMARSKILRRAESMLRRQLHLP